MTTIPAGDMPFGDWLTEMIGERQAKDIAAAVRANTPPGGKAADCSDAAISRWKGNKNLPDVAYLRPLAKALDVEVLEVFIRAGVLSREEAGVKELPERRTQPDPLVTRFADILHTLENNFSEREAMLMLSGLIDVMDGIERNAAAPSLPHRLASRRRNREY